MERLGLWGPYSGFANFEAFVAGITDRGVGGLEMLAMEMKATGTYVSRGLSYEQAEFELAQASRGGVGLQACGLAARVDRARCRLSAPSPAGAGAAHRGAARRLRRGGALLGP